MKFLFPTNGDVLLSGADGEVRGDRLAFTASLSAPAGHRVTVNDTPAVGEGEAYTAPLYLDGQHNRLEACDHTTGEKQTITVYWFPKAHMRYHFTIDDLILALEDIHQNRGRYASLFENPYMGMLQELHARYGTLVHINLFRKAPSGFTLADMTDRFRDEFTANADWLSFTFHAEQEFPDKPYEHADFETLMADYRALTKEIVRFAGPQTLRDTTTLHWGTSNIYGTRALRTAGFKALGVYLQFDEKGEPFVSHHLDKARVEHATTRKFWVDTEEDMVFCKFDAVLDKVAADETDAYFTRHCAEWPQSSFIHLVVHEQYYYPGYVAYEPDYRERLFNTVAWLTEHGYKPMHLRDVIREG